MTLEGNGPNNNVRVDAKTKAYLHPQSYSESHSDQCPPIPDKCFIRVTVWTTRDGFIGKVE